MLKSFIFTGLILFCQALASELVCDVSDACQNQVAGTKIEDPLDCHRYYVCIYNEEDDVVISDVSILCPEGTYFDEETQECNVEEFTCRNKCLNVFCTKTCDNVPDGTNIAYPNDCSKFRVCAHGTENVTGICSSETPYFNGTSCSTDQLSCCDICTPYCEYAFTEVEDPYDCYSFYLCQSDDYLPDYEHFSCEPGTYFNATEGDCVDTGGNSCNSICNSYSTPVYTTTPTTTRTRTTRTRTTTTTTTNSRTTLHTFEPTTTVKINPTTTESFKTNSAPFYSTKAKPTSEPTLITTVEPFFTSTPKLTSEPASKLPTVQGTTTENIFSSFFFYRKEK